MIAFEEPLFLPLLLYSEGACVANGKFLWGRRNKTPISGAAVIKVSGCVASESWEDVTKTGTLMANVTIFVTWVKAHCSCTSKVYFRMWSKRLCSNPWMVIGHWSKLF